MIKFEHLKPARPILLSDDILNEAFKNPDGTLTPLGKFIFYSKYSRWRENQKRREYWAETSQRSTEYNINLAIKHLEDAGILTDDMRTFHQKDLDRLFDNQLQTKQFLSGRTLWVGGTPVSFINPMSNFNCSFVVLDEWRKLGELLHLGMVGTGIGFRTLYADIDKLDKLKIRKWNIEHKKYKNKRHVDRSDGSCGQVSGNDENVFTIQIGDSKEGWRQAVDLFFNVLTGKIGKTKVIDTIRFNYDNVRPAGERLKRFGGRAGGPETIKAMFDKFHKILNGTLDKGYPKVTPSGRTKPIHLLDIANAIGKNIISGGVRSIAELGLIDPNDKDSINAKTDIGNKKQLNHRYVSNNSIFYEERPTEEQFDWQFDTLKETGEPCFVNAVVARRRRKNFHGVNPCVEILLDDRGLCNLTTVNIVAFVVDGKLDLEGLIEAFELATRAGLRMTLPKLELPEWDEIQQRDRLLGVSMTGYQDAMDAIDMGEDLLFQERLLGDLKKTVRQTADDYADMLGVNRPLLATCVKPEGTQSQMAGGVSSGLHVAHAPYTLRRVRSSAKDPISRAVFEHGWRMSAEFQDGSQHDEIKEFLQYVSWVNPHTPDNADEDFLQPKEYQYWNGMLAMKYHVAINEKGLATDKSVLMKEFENMADTYYGGKVAYINIVNNKDKDGYITVEMTIKTPTYDEIFSRATKIVIDFPQESPAKRTKANFGAIKQLEMYKMFLNHYAEHNPSNTISVRPEEWNDVKQWVKDNWDNMLAVSFLTLYDASYPLLPFQDTTKEEVEKLRDSMTDFDPDILMKYDKGEDTEIVDAGCESGACPIR